MILEKIKKTIENYSMLRKGDRVVAGVSGGSDSVGLLVLLSELQEYDLEIIVTHMNHGLRGTEAERDADYTRNLAERFGCKYEYRQVDTYSYSKQNGLSVEEAARDLRYSFFRDVMQRHSASRIATAHTIDDQAETVLIRIIRGSGTVGLSSILPVSDHIIRPLIELERGEIREYLSTKGINWVEDSTNLSDMYLRNRIRRNLLPLLKTFNPSVNEALSNLAFISRLESEYIVSSADSLAGRIMKELSFGIAGSVEEYKKQHQAMRFALLRNGIEKIKGDLRAVGFRHIVSADNLVMSDKVSGKIAFPGDVVVSRGYDYYCIARDCEIEESFVCMVEGPGKWDIAPGLTIEVEYVKNVDMEEMTRDENTGYFSTSVTGFPFEVSSFRKGDRFIPLGMKQSKKLKDLFVDCRIPRFFRKKIPVFRSGGEIFWVGGIRLDERFKVKGPETEVLKISLVNPGFRYNGNFHFV